MELKEEYNKLVEILKTNSKRAGIKLTNTAIAARLKMNRSYFSGLLGGSEEVKEKHIEDFKLKFRVELNGIVESPFDPSDPVNVERAKVIALQKEVAWLKSKVFSLLGKDRSYEDCLDDIDKSTIEELVSLRRANKK